jgi:hypothetical protein
VQRKWAVRPDETGTVSREALYQAFADAATLLDLAGGCLEVVVGRAPTNVPGEMVMTGALLCWKDRTDARPQAEVAQAIVPDHPERVAKMDRVTETLMNGEQEAGAYDEIRVEAGSMVPEDGDLIDPADGFDYTKLEAEDIENEPAAT